jgi:hypothetical protein
MNSLFSVIPCLRGEILVCKRPGDGSSRINVLGVDRENEGSKRNGSKYNFRNGTFGQGLSPFETYATAEKPARMGF